MDKQEKIANGLRKIDKLNETMDGFAAIKAKRVAERDEILSEIKSMSSGKGNAKKIAELELKVELLNGVIGSTMNFMGTTQGKIDTSTMMVDALQ